MIVEVVMLVVKLVERLGYEGVTGGVWGGGEHPQGRRHHRHAEHHQGHPEHGGLYCCSSFTRFAFLNKCC